MTRLVSFDKYWLGYLRAHSQLGTRVAHYVGITLINIGSACIVLAINPWFGIVMITFGILVAWSSHPLVEGNKPQMWTNPALSAVCGIRRRSLARPMPLGTPIELQSRRKRRTRKVRSGMLTEPLLKLSEPWLRV